MIVFNCCHLRRHATPLHDVDGRKDVSIVPNHVTKVLGEDSRRNAEPSNVKNGCSSRQSNQNRLVVVATKWFRTVDANKIFVKFVIHVISVYISMSGRTVPAKFVGDSDSTGTNISAVPNVKYRI